MVSYEAPFFNFLPSDQATRRQEDDICFFGGSSLIPNIPKIRQARKQLCEKEAVLGSV